MFIFLSQFIVVKSKKIQKIKWSKKFLGMINLIIQLFNHSFFLLELLFFFIVLEMLLSLNLIFIYIQYILMGIFIYIQYILMEN